MRRSTENVEPIAALHAGLARAVEALSLAELSARIEAVKPFATEARRARLQAVLDQRVGSVTVLLDSFHDPFNGAAVVRSCDVFGVPRVHVIERHEAFLASRSVSRGSELWVDVVTYGAADRAVDHLAAEGFALVAAHPEGEMTPRELGSIEGRVALVLGNEHDGIAEDLASRCMGSVRIPMRGFAESLNVSVTTAILLHELTRNRPGDLSALERARLELRGLLQSIRRGCDILEARALPLSFDGTDPRRPT